MVTAITFMVVITSLCNSPSGIIVSRGEPSINYGGMYVLIGFSVKTSTGRQIFHQVNTIVSIWLQKYAPIFVLGHY